MQIQDRRPMQNEENHPLFPSGAERIRAANARQDLVAGDHIAILSISDLYFHHGIYVGDGNVIDIIKPDNEDELQLRLENGNNLVRKVEIDEFIGDRNTAVFRLNYDNDTQLRTKALQRANCFYENPTIPPYNLLVNNCECFATFCWTGRYVYNFDYDCFIFFNLPGAALNK